MTWYVALKFLHVLAVVTWIGGMSATATLTGRMLRLGDLTGLADYFPHAMVFGQRVIVPSSLLVLVTGIPLVIIGKVGFGTFWVTWGFVGIILHFIMGATVIRKRGLELEHLLAATPRDDARVAQAGAKLRIVNLIYLLIMVSVIGAMVLKPVFKG